MRWILARDREPHEALPVCNLFEYARRYLCVGVFIWAAGAAFSCVGFLSLPLPAILVLPIWGGIGLLVYFFYSRSRSHVGRGIVGKIGEDDPPIYGVKM